MWHACCYEQQQAGMLPPLLPLADSRTCTAWLFVGSSLTALKLKCPSALQHAGAPSSAAIYCLAMPVCPICMHCCCLFISLWSYAEGDRSLLRQLTCPRAERARLQTLLVVVVCCVELCSTCETCLCCVLCSIVAVTSFECACPLLIAFDFGISCVCSNIASLPTHVQGQGSASDNSACG